MDDKRKLDDDDFPVKTDHRKIKSRDNEDVATADTSEIAEEIADRLNDDAWRRQEDNWSA
jgi:hypothetical protein